VNKAQFWVKPQLGVSYLAFNHDRPLFKGAAGTSLAKAINYAIDRKALLAQGGYLAGKRTDQILPPGIAGFRDASLYPLKAADVATAKKWAAKAGVKAGTAVEYYTSNSNSAQLAAQIVQFNLKQIGLTVNTHPFARGVQIGKGRHPWRAVRHHVGRLDRRLRRSVRLHQRPALRGQPACGEQQQRRLLQRPGIQQADDCCFEPVGRSAVHGVRES